MTIVLCGGGSGGHITPLLAVASEIKRQRPDTVLVYVGEKNGKFSQIAEDSGIFDSYKYIYAGKLRRYHNESMVSRLTDFKTNLLNIRDIFRMIMGTFQSIYLFKNLNPDSVLLKGGYVCVPASIGAKLSGATIITHDSDALPGLSNRFAARYAKYHATAMPARYYHYPKDSIRPVGLPINNRFRKYSKDEIRFLKEKFGIQSSDQVVLLTGGSNGAQRLNDWTVSALEVLFKSHKNLHAVLIAGKGKVAPIKNSALYKSHSKNITLLDFTDVMHEYSAIADVIVTRAGATTIAEFASQAKACILVPNPDLTGGHQLKNATVYVDFDSVIVVHEKDLRVDAQALYRPLVLLLEDAQLRHKLGANLNSTIPEQPADKSLADLLLGEGE